MKPTVCERRLEGWVSGAGGRYERLRYPRPEAQGEVAALRLVPSGQARARVVVAHGAGNDLLFPLVGLYRALVQAGVEVFAFDLDGNGRASTTRFSPETVTGAVPAAVEQATAGRDALPLHLVGHSFGGSLALHALAGGAVEAESAALVSSPLDVQPTWTVAVSELRGFFRPATLRHRGDYGVWGLVPAIGPLKRGAYPYRAGTQGPLGYVGAVREALARMDLEHAAERVRRPVLLVYSRADLLVPAAHGERLARALPRAELVLLEGLTHYGVSFSGQAVERVRDWVLAHTPDA